MTKKKSPVKRRVQARSLETQEAILEAATRVLRSDGLLGFNTNRVAETAGVSIGSLYQYFRDKEEILERLVNRALDRRAEFFKSRLNASLILLSPEKAIRRVIDAVLEGGAEDPELDRLLIQQAATLVRAERFERIDTAMMPIVLKAVETVLKLRGIEVRKKNLELAFYTLFQAVRGVTAMSQIRGFEPYGRDQIAEELTDLVCRYLLP